MEAIASVNMGSSANPNYLSWAQQQSQQPPAPNYGAFPHENFGSENNWMDNLQNAPTTVVNGQPQPNQGQVIPNSSLAAQQQQGPNALQLAEQGNSLYQGGNSAYQMFQPSEVAIQSTAQNMTPAATAGTSAASSGIGSMLPSAAVSTPMSTAPAATMSTVPASATEALVMGAPMEAAAGSAAAPAAPGMMATAGPYAAAALAAWGIGAGVDSAMDDWRNGEKQSGAIRGINALASPVNGFMGQMGGTLGSDKAQSILGVMNPITMPFAAADLAGVNFWSGKDKDQRGRDQTRAIGQKNKWLNDDFQLDLGNGQVLQMGKDGDNTYKNAAGQERHTYEIDWEDPNAGQAVGWIRPLALAWTGKDGKETDDLVGQLYNELTNDGNADLDEIRNRVVSVYNALGLKPSAMSQALSQMNLAQDKKDAAIAALEDLKPGAWKPGTKSKAPGAPAAPQTKPKDKDPMGNYGNKPKEMPTAAMGSKKK